MNLKEKPNAKKLKLKPSTPVIPEKIKNIIKKIGLGDSSDDSDTSKNVDRSYESNEFSGLLQLSVDASNLSESSINHEQTFSPLAASSQQTLPSSSQQAQQSSPKTTNQSINNKSLTFTPSNLKKMKQRSKFVALDDFEDEVAVDAYIRS